MFALWIVRVYLRFFILIPASAPVPTAPPPAQTASESAQQDAGTTGGEVAAGDTNLVDTALAAFGPLVGAVLASCFAGRTATRPPEEEA